jgi:hypothetical protein
MMKIIRKIIARFNEFRDSWADSARFHRMVQYWRSVGALDPYAQAEEERALRFRLEEFRNFASRRYLEDQSLTRDQIKGEWLAEVVGPMAKVPQAREAAKCLKAAVAAAGDEMFVGAAAQARREEIKKAIADARKTAPAARVEMRRRALQQ